MRLKSTLVVLQIRQEEGFLKTAICDDGDQYNCLSLYICLYICDDCDQFNCLANQLNTTEITQPGS